MIFRGLIALAFGTLGLGITEYVAMGLLPYWASSFEVSIATSGHAISAYALGVAIGAFSLLFLRKLKLKTILLLLILVHILGNALTAFAPSFDLMLISRFIAGLPHGSYFGVGSIIAQRIAQKGHGTSAVAIMTAGMTVANVFGVPLGTALALSLSWRVIFIFVAIWGVVVLLSALMWVKDVGYIEDTGFRGQFKFLKQKAPWLVLAATLFGNAGIFTMLSYVSPLLTNLSDLALAHVSAVMVVMGLCMVIFNLISGKLCDKFTPGKVAALCQALAVILLLAMALLGHILIVNIILICVISGLLFAISAPEQVSILRCSEGGLLLGASSVQAAFNLGNALGAFAGGIPLTLNLNIALIPVLGAIIAAIGFVSLFFYAKNHEAHFKDLTAQN